MTCDQCGDVRIFVEMLTHLSKGCIDDQHVTYQTLP